MYYDNHIMTKKEFKRQTEEYDKVKVRCTCGHRVVIPYWRTRQLCTWCKRYVYRDKKDEFKDRIRGLLNE